MHIQGLLISNNSSVSTNWSMLNLIGVLMQSMAVTMALVRCAILSIATLMDTGRLTGHSNTSRIDTPLLALLGHSLKTIGGIDVKSLEKRQSQRMEKDSWDGHCPWSVLPAMWAKWRQDARGSHCAKTIEWVGSPRQSATIVWILQFKQRWPVFWREQNTPDSPGLIYPQKCER